MRILISGGAGFVGSSMALRWKRDIPGCEVVVFDNLKRRGSEINLTLFRERGIKFCHGDIRQRSDLFELEGNFDLFIEASAEPSVLAGLSGSPDYLLQTNLCGTLEALEFARRRVGTTIFLSTSRVYSIAPLRALDLEEGGSRFSLRPGNYPEGVTSRGITESFPVNLPRSLYGGSKLASEIMIQEYVATYGLKAIINRCGVIAGPGQFGKTDQGVFTLWVARHFYKKPLTYIGFGGSGKQVRDLLHPEDLFSLIKKQIEKPEAHSGESFNVGGGMKGSTSLLELTEECQRVTSNQVEMNRNPETSPVDIPFYVSDFSKAERVYDWQPRYGVSEIIVDIYRWLVENGALLKQIFC
ncbi:MAG: NAD-dependent epimerase/dehydratase family protein [Oligoflexales bacterium]|nr:NAD-dependent epimerase/dehydratase family protein [Oligoflexales bacterium]